MSGLQAVSDCFSDPHQSRMPRWCSVLWQVLLSWRENPPSLRAAALAYYATIALAPLLLILIHFLGYLLGATSARTRVLNEVNIYAGQATADAVTVLIDKVNSKSGGGVTTFASIVLLVGSSSVFMVLQDAINTEWDITNQHKSGMSASLRKRLLSFLLVLAMGVLLVSSMLLTAVLNTIQHYFADILPAAFLFKIANMLAFFALQLFAWATLYKVIPDVEVKWRDVWLGAWVSSILFILGRLGLEFYFHWSKLISAYAAAGSLIVVLLWLYYSSHIALLGARITRIYADVWGSHREQAQATAAGEGSHGKD